MKTKYSAFIFFALIIFALVLPLLYYSKLSNNIAVHFNAGGQADGWVSKKSFLMTQEILTLSIAVLFGTLAFLVSLLPESIINMPNKDYWLNDENISETYKLLQKSFLWFGSITIAFIALVFQETIAANLSGSNKLNGMFWIYLVVYFLLVTIYLVKFIMHFSKKNIPG